VKVTPVQYAVVATKPLHLEQIADWKQAESVRKSVAYKKYNVSNELALVKYSFVARKAIRDDQALVDNQVNEIDDDWNYNSSSAS
jgi:hypothetical protein